MLDSAAAKASMKPGATRSVNLGRNLINDRSTSWQTVTFPYYFVAKNYFHDSSQMQEKTSNT